MEFLLRLVYTLPILTVDDEYETLGTSVVVPPERSNLVLSSDIPHSEREVLVFDSLDVES